MATNEKSATAVATIAPRRSILMTVAERYGMDAAPFEATLRATIFPRDGSREDFAAFLVVANEHQLNPLTKEIYAYPKRGGGIQALVGVDGWVTLINRQPMLDGIDFEIINDSKGALQAIACSISRKDRSKPVRVIETLAENTRPTEPWKQMPHRMLRHRALIQCARVAFGLAGIMDEDEARGANMIDVTPRPPAPKREDFRPAPDADLDRQYAATMSGRIPDDGEEITQSGAGSPSPTASDGGAGEGTQKPHDPAPPRSRKIALRSANGRSDWLGWAKEIMAAIEAAPDTEELAALQLDNNPTIGASPPAIKTQVLDGFTARAAAIKVDEQ